MSSWKGCYISILAAYIGFMVGNSAASVGRFPDSCGPFPWYMPVLVFGVIATPVILTYLMMRENREN